MLGVVTGAFLAVLLSAGSAAGIPDPQVKGKAGDGVVELIGQRDRAGRHAQTVAAGARRVVVVVVVVVPACAGNGPGAGPAGGFADNLCSAAFALCAGTAAVDDVMVWVFAGPAAGSPAAGQWSLLGRRCLGSAAAAAAGAVPLLTVRDFRRLPLPAGGMRVQPANLRTLVNVPTNVFVVAGVRVLDTTLLGFAVRVRATPREFRWRFGDGQVLVTSDPGAGWPDLRTTHTYARAGSARLGLVTSYSGEYSVAGGPWLPIAGTAQVASPDVTLTVLSARTQLVGGP